MDQHEALKLIAGGETLTLELKEKLSSKQERSICKEIAALATMQGGDLFVGVDDATKVVGINSPKIVCQKIEDWVAKYVDPAPQIDVNILYISGFEVIHVHIYEGISPLYCYDGRVYLRVATKSAMATTAQIEYLASTGKIISEMRAAVARVASAEQTLHPGRHTAAAIFGQGELATMNYASVRDRLFADLRKALNWTING